MTEPPLTDALIDVPHNAPADLKQWLGGLVSWHWAEFFLGQQTAIAATPQRLRRVTLSAQTAAVPTTAFPLAALAAGLYKVTWFLRIVTPASVSSAATVTIGSTDTAGVAYTQSGPSDVDNVVNLARSGVILMRCQQASPLTYAISYASVGTPMTFDAELLVESVGA